MGIALKADKDSAHAVDIQWVNKVNKRTIETKYEYKLYMFELQTFKYL